jgi:predicted HTH domain antitoxin
MSISLNIPESVIKSLRVPEGEAEARLRIELAITLYAQALLSLGKASELANMSRYLFADVVAARGIPRHYGPEELAEDLAYANGE